MERSRVNETCPDGIDQGCLRSWRAIVLQSLVLTLINTNPLIKAFKITWKLQVSVLELKTKDCRTLALQELSLTPPLMSNHLWVCCFEESYNVTSEDLDGPPSGNILLRSLSYLTDIIDSIIPWVSGSPDQDLRPQPMWITQKPLTPCIPKPVLWLDS